MEKRKWMSVVVLMLIVVMAIGVTACGNKTEEQPEEEPAQEEEQQVSAGPELTDDQIDGLMWKVSDQEVELRYQKYMPDEGFAKAEVFGIDRDGDEGSMYAYLAEGEYVVADGKAYNVAGSAGEVIIKFQYTDDMPDLKEVVWSADGDDHDAWMKENYPAEYLEKAQSYEAHDKDGQNLLFKEIDKDVEKEMGAPVDTDNLLEIDEEKGTYQIVKTIESGSTEDGSYKFDTEVIKEGKLEDLNK